MKPQTNTPVGQFVSQDYQTAAIFSKYGIDFCCKGHLTLEEACNKNGIEIKTILEKLNEVLNTTNNTQINYQSWPLDLLADYIEKTHHKYVEEQIPVILQFMTKLCRVHGEKHPELLAIHKLFTEAAGELTQHMKKEEIILFPFIRKMAKSLEQNDRIAPPHFDTVVNPITMMMKEHDNEGDRFRQIASLSNDYTPPADSCTTYNVTFSMLKEFEENLHQHIHLENNILFPKAISMENQIVEKTNLSTI